MKITMPLLTTPHHASAQPIHAGAALVRTFRHSERGSSLVESALVINLFLLLVFGIMDFGRAVYAYNFVSYAARVGARYASVRGSSSGHAAQATDVQATVTHQAIALDAARLTVTTTWTPDNKPGSVVSVRVAYTYRPMITFIMSSPLSIASTSKLIISQ
jgi:Flp pilus assembly protein TadG